MTPIEPVMFVLTPALHVLQPTFALLASQAIKKWIQLAMVSTTFMSNRELLTL